MLDSTKTKKQLLNELKEMHQRVFELEQSEVRRKQAEEALQMSDECFRQIYQNMAIGVARVTLKFCIESANDAYCHMLGYREDELIGKHLKDITHPETLEENLKKQALLAAGEIDHYRMGKQFIHKSGRIIYGILDANLVRDTRGQPAYFIGSVLDITERKQAEDELHESHERLLTILNSIDADVYVSDMETYEILFTNQHMQTHFGENVVGKACWDVFRGNSGPCTHCTNNQLINADGNPAEVVIWEAQNPITERWYINYDRAIKWFDGRIVRLQVATDITERKLAETALRESETQFRSLFESSPIGIGVVDRQGNLLLFNEAMQQSGGYTPTDIQEIGNVAYLYQNPDQRDEALKRFQEQGFLKNFPAQFKRKDGTYYDALLSLSHLHFRGQPCIQAIVQDITERKRAEEALQESQRQLSTLMSNLPGMAYRCKNDPNWTMEFVSNGCLPLTGYKSEELVGNSRLSYAEIIHPEDRQMVWETVQAGLETQQNFQLLYRIITASKNIKWVWEQGQGIAGAENDITVLEGFITDITDRVQAENTLQKYTAQLETLNTIAAALITSLELDQVLELILDQIGKVIPFDSGAIFLYEDAGLRVMVDRNLTRSPRGHLFPGEDELFAEILQTRAPLILNNPKKDARFKNWGHSEHIASWMGVPLFVRDTLIGFLTLDSNQPETYSPEQADLTQPFASQAAQAIENARLYARVIQDTNEMERRVQERTEELQSFVNLTAGREVRMAELKRVIVKLRAQLENAGITPIANDPLLGPSTER